MAAPASLKHTDRGSWDKFISLCTKIGAESGRLMKTEIVKEFVSNYNGDLKIFLKLILPKESQRVYQVQYPISNIQYHPFTLSLIVPFPITI